MRAILILSVCGLLAGCATAQDIAAGDDADCQAYGAQPGSQAYYQCRMAKDQQRQQLRAAVIGSYIANH